MGVAAVVAMVSLSNPARADFVEDHPEWFGMTDAPEAPRLGPSSQPGAVFALRPSATPTWAAILAALKGHPLLLLHAGGEERAAIETLLADQALDPDSHTFVDLGELNTSQAGEFLPFHVQAGEEMLAVDPRYYPNLPYDDAAGSRVAAALGTCAYRPPIFLTPALIDADGQGLCVVSSKLYGKTPALTEAEFNGQLMRYLGCRRIIKLQPLQDDGEGRLDIFFRLADSSTLLLGSYEADQHSTNRAILKANLEKLEAELVPEYTLIVVPLPDPIQVGPKIIFPSYLGFLRIGDDRVLVPTFANNDVPQNLALKALAQAFPDATLDPLDATALAQASSSLTAMVAALPAPPWAPECAPPEVLCPTAHPLDCDQCWDECAATEKFCTALHDWAKCQVGTDGCYDLAVQTCKDEGLCEEGACKAPPGPCDTMPETGVCDGDVLHKCVQSNLVTINCAEDNQFCAVVDEAGAVGCIPMCASECTVGGLFCKENAVYQCENVGDEINLCGKGVLSQSCGPGQACQEGACVAVIEPEADIGGDADTVSTVPGAETSDWQGGFRKADGGCRAAGRAGGTGALLLLLLALGLLGRRLVAASWPPSIDPS